MSLAYLKVGMEIIGEPAFDILRTQEQLGYDVSADMKDTYGVIGIAIFVNSQVSLKIPYINYSHPQLVIF